MYAIVEFEGVAHQQVEIAIVPLLWLSKKDTKCFFPLSTKGLKLEEFIKRLTPFKSSWPRYKVSKVHFRTSNYDIAEKQLKHILEENDEKISSESGACSVKSLIVKVIRNDTNSSTDEEDAVENITLMNSHFASATPTSSSSSCSTKTIEGPLSDFQNVVLKELAKIAANVEHNTQVLNDLARQSMKHSTVLPPDDAPDLPLKTLTEFEQLETKLKEPKYSILKAYLVRRLAAVGGSGIEQTSRRIMKFLITNELGINFNWKGRDKISFEKTTLMTVVYEAAKLQYPAQEQSDKLIAGAVQGWLKLSKARAKKK